MTLSQYRLSVIVCAHNEARFLPACLHSLLAQSRVPDEILVVNNASTDEMRAVALQIPHVQVVDEPRKGLVVARETGRRAHRRHPGLSRRGLPCAVDLAGARRTTIPAGA